MSDEVVGLVIAAGYGTRLKPYSESYPKSLLELEPGVTVLDYLIGLFKEVGINDFYVVTRAELQDVFKSRVGESRVLVVDVSLGDGNLWTLHQALSRYGEVFKGRKILLTMSDHIYEKALLLKVLQASKNSDKVLLCLDRSPRGGEVSEGLKVVVDGDVVVSSGKGLPPVSGIDTGVFIIPNHLLEYVGEVVKEKGRKASLADFINYLGGRGLVGFVDVTKCLWTDIDTPEDLVKARKLYWRILSKNLIKESDGVVSRFLNRKVSTQVSLWLYRSRVKVSPNVITALVGLLGLAASVAVFYGNALLGASLAILNSIFDGVDGEVARLYKISSKFGALLDTLTDRVVDTAFMFAGIYYMIAYEFLDVRFALVLGFIALSGAYLVSYVSNFVEDKELVNKLRNSFPYPTRDVRLFILPISLALGRFEVGLAYVALASWFYVASVVKGYRVVGRGVKNLVLERRSLIPEVRGYLKMDVEELFLSVAYLAILTYVTVNLHALTLKYGGELSMLLSRVVVLVGVILSAYLIVKVVTASLKIAGYVKEVVVTKLWVTPTVYEKIVLEALSITTLVFVKPFALVFLNSITTAEYVEVSDLLINALTLTLMLKLMYDVYKAVEHLIHPRKEA
ncbi:MAG: hypothetical protein B7O98_03995 [Zestosphaera tikiterensis]|uniref:Bifunctional IPC transferase and DIPP synthase n=1 Tax=Zestosphaera tikiterensis TaxID=1973259 RepID=A0A2R7Y7T4_9CREN|nr:MAG: hypothetical protein B7O98_03995 [Zestosphaera tikiterensis]